MITIPQNQNAPVAIREHELSRAMLGKSEKGHNT